MLNIHNECTDPYFNIASEEYLLKNTSENVFMLWQNEPSAIIGKHQSAEAELDLSFVESNDIKVVRRYSGGGAVYHDLGNLNFTFIESTSNPDFDKYAIMMQSFLKSLNITAEIDKRRGLTVDGLKVSGSAQCIHKGRVMYHATLLFSSNLPRLVSTLDSPVKEAPLIQSAVRNRARFVKSVKSPVTNLSEYLPKDINLENFKKKAIEYFFDYKEAGVIYFFDEKDIKSIDQLKEQKYSTNDWNFNACALI